ncbi:MAG: DsbA family protein [Janthinobacterium lividum]
MPNRAISASLATAALLLPLFVAGCHAQVPAGGKLSPEMARRIALTIRTKAQLPFNYDVKVADLKPSTQPGWDEVTVLLGEEGKPAKPMAFLLSKDGKTLAQMNTFDISKDPKTLVSDAGRPSKGGSEKAPVDIVVFDDLECPFCARMHAQMFPAVLNRYGDKVRIAYKDFPLTQIHPWATHAAVDADCLAAQSVPGYWNLVDTLHADLSTIGVDPKVTVAPDKQPEKTLPVALAQLDKATLDEGKKQKVDEKKLQACVSKQDETGVKAGLAEGETLNVNGVPAIFVNGEMITGAVPIEYVYRAVDSALLAQGITPPPPVPVPSLDAPPPATPAR